MFRDVRIAVVMPAYNVEAHLHAAISTMPAFVDDLIVVDDSSQDGTAEALRSSRRRGLVRMRHPHNRGVGAAIATGYVEALRRGAQVVAVMAGDGQMDPADLSRVIRPVVDGEADYVKGNRFLHEDVWRVMPRTRLWGNMLLSVITKVTSGYARIFDSQCGFTAISAPALRAINCRLYQRYGYPNDLLARLGAAAARVAEVPVRPVYDGQASGIRIWTVLYPILFVLARSMVRRIWARHLRPLLGGPPPARCRPLESAGSDPRLQPEALTPAAGEEWASQIPSTLSTVEATPGLIHADRSTDHLFPSPPL